MIFDCFTRKCNKTSLKENFSTYRLFSTNFFKFTVYLKFDMNKFYILDNY